ncbi:MAG: DUF3592 domain-containing protein [Fibromonadaceae bacterium]|jgi:hypothetical protein|nr:DUF3592 domain-containing protein [Fibromonadaceae bacterium]
MKNQNFVNLFIGSVFAIVGLLVVIGGFYIMESMSDFASKAVPVEGVIANIEAERYRNMNNETRTRNVISVDYVINGKKYENTLTKGYRSSMRTGDAITLYYLPDEPWKVSANAGKEGIVGGVAVSVFGSIFFIIGLLTLNKARKKIALKKYLKQWNKTIYAEVIAVETDLTISEGIDVGRRRKFKKRQMHHPYSFLKCAVKKPDTNEIIATYKSDSVRNSNKLQSYIGKQVKVYLDPRDDAKYYVALEELL